MALFDPGLQPERTELAWRRTALLFGVGSLVATRLLPAVLGNPWWTIVGLSGIVFAALLWVLARHRARAVNAALATHGDRAALPGGGLLFALGVLSGVGAALALVIVLGVSGLWS